MMKSWRKHPVVRRAMAFGVVATTAMQILPVNGMPSPPPKPHQVQELKPGLTQRAPEQPAVDGWVDGRLGGWKNPGAERRVDGDVKADGGLPQDVSKLSATTSSIHPPTHPSTQVGDVRNLTPAEMKALRGRGPYRNQYFNGTLPWQRSFHDVNLCNGNLFKSFTDIQISPARGAGLALQRTYNSNDPRVGPFGVGWTHAYDIRMEEAGNNNVPRTDFFGGKHTYHRDADGLYSPPVYLFDTVTSDYESQLVNGPPKSLDDTQTGEDGTTKHFVANGNERDCDYIQDRYGNTTNLSYTQPAQMADGSTRNLLTSVTDPSGRSLTFTWANLGTTTQPAWRITEADAPIDPNTTAPIYRVTYEYYTDTNSSNAANELYNLKAVHLDSGTGGLNRTTSFTYTSVSGDQGTENGLLASVSDPLGHTVSYDYTTTFYHTPTLPAAPSGGGDTGGDIGGDTGAVDTGGYIGTDTTGADTGSYTTGCDTSGYPGTSSSTTTTGYPGTSSSTTTTGYPGTSSTTTTGYPGTSSSTGTTTATTTGTTTATTTGTTTGTTGGNGYITWSTPTGTAWVSHIYESGGVDSSGNPRQIQWEITGSGNINSYDFMSFVELLGPGNNMFIELWTDNQLRELETMPYGSDNIFWTNYDSSNNAIQTGTEDNLPNNGVGRLRTIDPPFVKVVNDFTYGPHGNQLTHTVEGFAGTETTSYYDADKYFQKASVTDMNGHTTNYDYYTNDDANPGNRGQVKWVRDARYGTTGKEFDYTYNQYGQKASETNLNSVTTTYTYGDTWGNLTTVIQDPGTGHLNRATVMDYDVAGHVLQSTDPMSQHSTFVYNSLGQPLTASFPSTTNSAAEQVSYSYGANGCQLSPDVYQRFAAKLYH